MVRERVRVFKNKISGLSYCLFGEPDSLSRRVDLYCNQDDSGSSDITIDEAELNENYELIEEYFEEA